MGVDVTSVKALGVLILSVGLGVSAGAGARDGLSVGGTSPEKDEDFFDMSIERLMDVRIDTVYGASKHTQNLAEAPASVSIITAEEIRCYGYRTLADILQSVPGFFINYDRFYHYVGVRGYRPAGTYDTGILLLIDGHRTNQNVGDGPAFGTHFLLDVDLIEKIEIIRGPGSALYGSNALFAVINVVTKRGADIGGLELSGQVGSYKTTKGRITYGQKIESGPEILVSGTRYRSDGPTLYFPEFDSPETANGWVDNDDDQFENVAANVQWGDVSLLLAHTDRDKRLPTAPWGAVFGDKRTRDWDENTLVGLTYAKELSDAWAVNGRLAYSRYYYYGDWPSDYAEEGEDPDIVVNRERYRGRWWEAEAHIVGKPVDGHTFTAGGEFRYNQLQEQINWDEETYLYDSRSGHNWGLYVQDEFRLFDKTTFVGGLRYDRYGSSGGNLNPRLALIQGIREDTTIKLLYGRAFRAPSVYELYYNDGGYSTKAANELDPEIIETWEAVLERVLTPHWKGTVSAFYYKMDDLIAKYTDPSDGLQVFRNVDQVDAPGVELALNGRWESGVSTRASYSYVDAEDGATDEDLVNSPRHLARLNLIVPVLEKALFAGLEVQYNGRSRTLDEDETDAFVLTNLTFTYRSPSKRLEITAGVYNLFDREYSYPAFDEHVQDQIEQDGRTFRVGLMYRF